LNKDGFDGKSFLDDLIIVPLGIAVAVSFIPPELMAEFRREASRKDKRPRSLAGAATIVCVWALCLTAGGLWMFRSRG
jgi:hypothetical protein